MGRVDGETCTFDKGRLITKELTGDEECDAYTYVYECGGRYDKNYMDVVGSRDHDCFWHCGDCKYQQNEN